MKENIRQAHVLRTKLADRLVSSHTLVLASELIMGIQNLNSYGPKTLKECFDVDDEKLESLRYVRDHEETFNNTVDDADDIETLSQICAEARLVWDDICTKADVPDVLCDDDTSVSAPWLVAVGDTYVFFNKNLDAQNYALELAIDKVRDVIKAEPDVDYVAFCNNYEDINEVDREILEHWIVDKDLATELLQNGEAVVDVCGLFIWGRTTSGQSVAMDWCIQQIAFDLYKYETLHTAYAVLPELVLVALMVGGGDSNPSRDGYEFVKTPTGETTVSTKLFTNTEHVKITYTDKSENTAFLRCFLHNRAKKPVAVAQYGFLITELEKSEQAEQFTSQMRTLVASAQTA